MTVDDEQPQREPTRQLNVAIPDRLHRRMKIRSARTGVSLKAELLRLIEREYADDQEG